VSPISGNDGAISLQACALRAARLAADGSTPAGATNSIVTNGLIKLEGKLVYESGAEFTVINGCGAVAHTYKDPDHLKRIDATLTITNPDVEFSELSAGMSLITAGGQSIGASAPAVGAAPPLGISLEVWTKAWIGGGAPPGVLFTDGVTTSSSTTLTSATAAFTSADVGRTISGSGISGGTTISSVTNGTTIVLSAAATATATGVSITIGRPGAYWRYVFPKAVLQPADFTLENAARQIVFTGPMYENPGINNGPANDFPTGLLTTANRLYSYFRDSALPTVGLGYQSVVTQ
jgi:hypothetical protein